MSMVPFLDPSKEEDFSTLPEDQPLPMDLIPYFDIEPVNDHLVL